MRQTRLIVGALVGMWTSAAAQGTVASRVAAVRDGVVRMEYASRPSVCGNGRDVVAFRNAFFSRSIESWGGRWESADCKPGPVRVAVTMSGGEPIDVRTEVGGSWRNSEDRVTNLGVVSPREASAYFFSIAPALDRASEKGRMLLPAVLAADAPVIEPLRAIARNDDRSNHLRRQAIQWLGLVGDASVIPDLVQFAKGGDAGTKKSLSNSAIAALAGLDDDAGIPSLIELSHYQSADVRHDVVFWLGQTDDPRAIRRLRQVIDDRNEDNRVRKQAIFAFGQCDAAPTKDLITIYQTLTDPSLREQAIFALSQRDDNSATDALINIAKTDDDRRMRGKALFWLAQKRDPRVTKLLSDILVK